MRQPSPDPDGLPYRGDGAGRPGDLPLPPGRMPLVRHGRPLKRWRYVGAYGERFMLCAGKARIGGIPQAWWALWDREKRDLHERTMLGRGRGRVELPDGAARVNDGRVAIDVRLEIAGDAVEVVSRHGREHIWTRKYGGRALGTISIDGEQHAFDAAAIVDDSAGYHARHTVWAWSAGVGTSVDGAAVMWNLVAGVHDGETGSERSVWVDGVASEVGPVRFADDLGAIAFTEGREIRFVQESVRARKDNLLLFASDYTQPFGTFEGTLPEGTTLSTGFGVMERHDVRW